MLGQEGGITRLSCTQTVSQLVQVTDLQHFNIQCIMVIINISICLQTLRPALHSADFPKLFAVTCGLPPSGIYYISEEIINNIVDALTSTEMNLLLHGPGKPIYLYWLYLYWLRVEISSLFIGMTEKAVTHKCSLRVTLPSLALEKKNPHKLQNKQDEVFLW